MKRRMVIGMILALFFTGCATPQKTGQIMQTVATTAPVLAYQLDAVYATLIDAKAVSYTHLTLPTKRIV